jgi:hypothetical protein
VVFCGLTIWLPPLKPRHVIACASAPALALLGTLLAVYLIPVWLAGVFGPVMSTLTASGAGVSPLRALSFTLFASLITIPAIAVAIYARNRVLDAGKAVYGLDPRRLGRVEKIVNSALRIGATVAALLVGDSDIGVGPTAHLRCWCKKR